MRDDAVFGQRDAVFELHVRERMLRKGGNVDALHKATVGFVNAEGQAALARRLMPHLSEEEQALFRRARNHKGVPSRKVGAASYQLSTGLEAVFGYLYLKPDRTRLEALLALADTYQQEEPHAP